MIKAIISRLYEDSYATEFLRSYGLGMRSLRARHDQLAAKYPFLGPCREFTERVYDGSFGFGIAFALDIIHQIASSKPELAARFDSEMSDLFGN